MNFKKKKRSKSKLVIMDFLWRKVEKPKPREGLREPQFESESVCISQAAEPTLQSCLCMAQEWGFGSIGHHVALKIPTTQGH